MHHFERQEMKSNCDSTENRSFSTTHALVVCALATALFTPCIVAQAQSDDSKPSSAKPAAETETYHTFYLNNITQQNELMDIQTDIRNMLRDGKIYSVPSQNAISVRGTAEDLQLAQKMIADLDRPRKIYRITYNITDTDGDKRIGTQSFSLVAASGEKTIFKQGSRVPIVTGSYDAAASIANTQVQYQDVGMNIEATVNGDVDGLRLRSKVEQTNVADEKSGVGAQDPIVRQTVLEGTASVLLGKSLMLGSLDIPGTTRKQDIEVVAELVK
jgi:type II secretory pathway component GspD/PulD (secretin)